MTDDRRAEILRIETADPDATRAAGRLLGEAAPDGAVVLLAGPLGAGKTTFAQGVARGCGVTGPVTSPTYTLVAHHRGARPFLHVDLYRLDSAAALTTLDLDAILAPEGVACVEWPALLADRVGPPRADVAIRRAGEGARSLAIRFAGSGWDAARRALEARTVAP